jgi:hypothetical protein
MKIKMKGIVSKLTKVKLPHFDTIISHEDFNFIKSENYELFSIED